MTRKQRLILCIFGLVGTGMVLLATSKYGAGLSPDSVNYVDGARSLAAGLGLVNRNGTPVVLWPPLFPALLAGAEFIVGVDPLSAAGIVNAILFGFIVSLSGVLFFRRVTSSFALVLLGVASVLVAIPLMLVSEMAWSEPLFIACVLLFLIWAESHLEKGDTGSLVLMSVAAASASMSRYIGSTVIISGATIIVLFSKKRLPTKLVHLGVFLLLSSAPLALWLSRNHVVSGTLMGSRSPSQFSLAQSLNFTFFTLLSWYLPPKIIQHSAILALLGIAVGFIAAIGARTNWPRAKARLWRLAPTLTFVVLYTSILVISATTMAYDRIDHRLLSPLYVPLTLLLFGLAERSVRALLARRGSRLVNAVLVTGTALWLIHPLTTTSAGIMNSVSQGAGGFNTIAWRQSETIEYLQQQSLDAECQCYTNAPDALYILAGLRVDLSPVRTAYNSPQTVTEAQDLAGLWPEQGQAYLVWLDNIHKVHLFTVEELEMFASVEPILRFADGTIYLVTRKASGD